jgi:hypothetical protein
MVWADARGRGKTGLRARAARVLAMVRIRASVLVIPFVLSCAASDDATNPGDGSESSTAHGGSTGSDGGSTSLSGATEADGATVSSGPDPSGPDPSGTAGEGSTSSPEPSETAGSVTPGYQPFFAIDCDDGELGARAEGPDALASVIGGDEPRVVYSDEQAVDSVGQSCRSTAHATENFFGGRYLDAPAGIGEGDDVWLRHALFFPDGFCFGHGTTSGDGWGTTKWMRIEFDNGGDGPGDRLTLQLTNFAAEGCSDETEVFGATREYAGNANLRPPSPSPIPTGAWHMVQWHVHLAADDTGFIRFWVDDVYQGQVDGITLGAPDREIAFVQYGDYWNGSPYEDVAWFLDEVIMTSEPPDTVDAGGLPYIDPAARVDDWE